MGVLISKDQRGRAHLVLAFDRADGMTELICFGGKRHRHRDGSCRCIKAVLASLDDEARARVVVVPHGGEEATNG